MIFKVGLKQKIKRDLTAVFSSLMGGERKDGDRLFPEMHRERVRGSRHKMRHWALPWDLRNNFFSPKGKVPITGRSQGHKFCILGAVQNIAGQIAEQSDLAGLVLRRGKQKQHPGVLPTCNILWFVTQAFSNPKFQYLQPTHLNESLLTGAVVPSREVFPPTWKIKRKKEKIGHPLYSLLAYPFP